MFYRRGKVTKIGPMHYRIVHIERETSSPAVVVFESLEKNSNKVHCSVCNRPLRDCSTTKTVCWVCTRKAVTTRSYCTACGRPLYKNNRTGVCSRCIRTMPRKLWPEPDKELVIKNVE